VTALVAALATALERVPIFGFLFRPQAGQLRTIDPRQVRKAMDKK